MSSVGIVLLNYNSTQFTHECVKSLWSTKDKKDEYHIVVWDNASKVIPTQKEIGKATLVCSSTNDGFALGNNKAAQALLQKEKIDYLLFLNNDTRVTRGMVRVLIERFEKEKNCGCVVPKIYFERGHEYWRKDYSSDEQGNVIWYAGGEIDWDSIIAFHRGVDEVDRGQFETSTETEFAAGTALLTTPSIWKKLHGFDPQYFLYYEDVDLSLRLKVKKKKICYEPKATLFHINAGSSEGSGSQLHVYYQTRNRLRLGFSYARMRTKLALLKEAKNQYIHGSAMQRKGIVDALLGKWGKQL
ncbi:hypothetical protein C5B42_00810 [Candidatus Cerribacteria bacterium 'Amazon FNV 2010 28 9']|uniref:Glycosyltransferase 2-like domain-containing protein n=1 Tax=Candidatus Cerribacteria bacterium 'Amazon FNV 2010 28 9' TaxID=2081795 RepID=A0A317JQ39_9BACT|nr:MAG: hypothetical protein C5B42_00810 [Candidatus Cerribacteria bacterium 'Amazon FNV 2010 28 9']